MIRSLLLCLALPTPVPARKPIARVAAPKPTGSGNGRSRVGAASGLRRGARLRDWAELLRVSALFTVPGDALVGAAATGLRPNRGTAYAMGASLCLYEAGMALNDWADRDEDAVDRPHRPLPSDRISPTAALGAAGLLTVAGLAFAARAGRPALAVATALTATVWAYDLRLKHTSAAPAAMAAARALDLLLGATATMSAPPTRPSSPGAVASTLPAAPPHGPLPHRGAVIAPSSPGAAAPAAGTRGPESRQETGNASGGGVPAGWGGGAPARPCPTAPPRHALRTAGPAAAALAAHTYAVTTVSRHETQGGSTLAPLAALGATATLGAFLAQPRTTAGPVRVLLTAAYVRTAATGYLHAALNPSPTLTQHAVGGGIRAMIPLQAALAARCGASTTGLAVMGLVPLARTLARKVSPT
jgi:hypothetical protein